MFILAVEISPSYVNSVLRLIGNSQCRPGRLNGRSSSRVPATHVVDWDCIPGVGLQPSPPPVIAGIWGMNQ